MCEHYGHFENYYGQRTLYMDGYKLICVHGERDQLYHIALDPYEMEELSGDPRAAGQLTKMRAELNRQRERYGDDWPAFTRETLSRGQRGERE